MNTHVLAPPGRLQALRELATPLDMARSALKAPALMTCPRGKGETVIVLPGYGTGDRSTTVLRTFLRSLGYRARGWNLGTNRGDVEALMPLVQEYVAAHSKAADEPVHLIGWSLGGVLAREAARDLPRQVRSVITLGTPVVGGPRYTAVGRIYAAQGFDFDHIERAIAERNKTPIRVPVISIYSKADGIVAWRAAIDHHNPHVEHVEVSESHLSLGFSSSVFRIIAERLARGPATGAGSAGYAGR
jgi:pimeloyl-ACP methyl ester carboxylesterase